MILDSHFRSEFWTQAQQLDEQYSMDFLSLNLVSLVQDDRHIKLIRQTNSSKECACNKIMCRSCSAVWIFEKMAQQRHPAIFYISSEPVRSYFFFIILSEWSANFRYGSRNPDFSHNSRPIHVGVSTTRYKCFVYKIACWLDMQKVIHYFFLLIY